MKTKVFISQPMLNQTTAEFFKTREKIITDLDMKKGSGNYEILDSYCEDFESDNRQHIAKNISLISEADAAYFSDGWKKCPACKAERTYTDLYGIEIIKE